MMNPAPVPTAPRRKSANLTGIWSKIGAVGVGSESCHQRSRFMDGSTVVLLLELLHVIQVLRPYILALINLVIQYELEL